MEECSKSILKIGEFNCIIIFKVLIQMFLKNFYNQGINVQITTKDIKMKTDFAWNPRSSRHSAKSIFEIYPPVSGLNFSINMSVSQVRVKIRETERDTTFEIS